MRSAWLLLVLAVLPRCQFPNYNLPSEADGARSGQSGATSGMSMGASGGSEGAGAPGEEPTCLASESCVQALPSGWLGPVAFWKANSGTDAPDCPDGYEAPTDLHGGASGDPASCHCSCGPPEGETCSGVNDVTIYVDLNCETPCFETASTSCTAITGCNGNQGTIFARPSEPDGGSCQEQVTKSTQPARWKQDARLCTLSASGDNCGPDGSTCAKTPEPPFASQLCIYRVVLPGQPLPTCPESYPNGPEAFYTELTDERDCSACQCSAPEGGSCGGIVSLALGDVCDEDFEYQLGSGCKQFGFASRPKQIAAEYELVAGTCSVALEPQPLGAVEPTGNAHVVCCP